MLIKKPADIRESEVTPKELYLRRREFITGGRQPRRRGGDRRGRLAVRRRGPRRRKIPNAYKFPDLKKGEPVRHDREAELVQGRHHLQQLLRVRSRQGRPGALRRTRLSRGRGRSSSRGSATSRAPTTSRTSSSGSRSRSASTACAASKRGRWSFRGSASRWATESSASSRPRRRSTSSSRRWSTCGRCRGRPSRICSGRTPKGCAWTKRCIR